MTASIRDERPGDYGTIDDVHRTAFLHEPHSQHNEAAIVRGLRADGQLTVALVAGQDGQVVGHIAISPVQVADGTRGWYGLGPVAVTPAHQGKGIGQQLVHAALSRLRALGSAGCVVLGEPAFYARFGFRPDPALVLPGVPPEYFQALRFSGPAPRGAVAYAAAFKRVGEMT